MYELTTYFIFSLGMRSKLPLRRRMLIRRSTLMLVLLATITAAAITTVVVVVLVDKLVIWLSVLSLNLLLRKSRVWASPEIRF
jgi:hypothetical protein